MLYSVALSTIAWRQALDLGIEQKKSAMKLIFLFGHRTYHASLSTGAK